MHTIISFQSIGDNLVYSNGLGRGLSQCPKPEYPCGRQLPGATCQRVVTVSELVRTFDSRRLYG